jgi:hypothetical protein
MGTPNIEHRTLNVEGAIQTGELAAILNRVAVADCGYVEGFDSVKASQARSDLIKATIIFFGLDSNCPCPSCNLNA